MTRSAASAPECPHCGRLDGKPAPYLREEMDVPGPGEPYLCSGCGKPFLVSATPAADDRDKRAAGEHEIDPRADVAEGLASAGGAGGSAQGLHADEYRPVTATHEGVAAFAPRRIYVASSWRNTHQPRAVELLRELGNEVYDFRNPRPGDTGFAWSSIDPDWLAWQPEVFRGCLRHPVAQEGFKSDFEAMKWADTFVLLLPCGRSAHLEAGWAIGAGKPTCVVLHEEKFEPELMYLLAPEIVTNIGGRGRVDRVPARPGGRSMSAAIRPERKPYDEPQTWWFTFGFTHAHPNGYIVVEDATGEEARELMVAAYGNTWGFQYDARDWFRDGISQEEKYGLHEVTRLRPRPEVDA